ncbi:MAG: hypothetical protein RLZZ422_2142 [Pseudomonadota bacterium]|jgi:cytochrome c553
MAKLLNWCSTLSYSVLGFLLGLYLPMKVLAADYSSHAYSTYPSSASLTKVTPIHRLTLQSLSSPTAISQAVTEALTATRSMPIGYKALINLDLDFLQIAKATNSAALTDVQSKPIQVTTSTGLPLPDHGIWLDNGVAAVAARTSEFFRQYKAAGGTVDLITLDYRGLALTAADIKAAGEATGNLASYLTAIQTDTRFATLQSTLGFSDLITMYATDTQAAQRQQVWNAVMKARIATYLNQAFYTPVRTYFPAAQVSGRDYAYYSGLFTVPTEHNKASSLVGTHQSKFISGLVPSSGIVINETTYPATAFNALRYELNRMRNSALASNRALHPYVSPKSQTMAPSGYSALLKSTDLYQEMLLHSGLLGARYFIYFNTATSATDDLLLDQVLSELDQQVGTTTALTRLADNGIDWSQPYILTQANTTQGRVWRFTPSLDTGKTVSSTIANSFPAQFNLAGNIKVTVPSARIQTMSTPVSTQGVWLREDSSAAIVNCAQPTINQSCIAYYPNNNFTAQPALMVEQPISFNDTGTTTPLLVKNWGYGGTDAGVAADGFSIDYQSTLKLLGGTYSFSLKADDHAQLWIDNQLVLDGKATTTQSTRTLTKEITLGAGNHNVRLQYTDISAGAAIDLSFKRLGCSLSTTKTCLTYIDKSGNLLITESPFVQTSNGLSFDFSTFTFPTNISTSGMTMRWDGLINISNAGDYAFEIEHGLGTLTIWVDGQIVYANNGYSAKSISQALKNLTKGNHTLRIELKAKEGSFLKLNWLKALADCKTVPLGSFCGEYFDNATLTGTAKRFQSTPKVDFIWNGDAPVAGGNFPTDKFSVRWVGDFDLEAGNYTFTTLSDDGIKLWVDDVLVIGAWRDLWNATFKQGIPLKAGIHRIKLEYYDNTGGALAKLSWAKSSTQCIEIPDNSYCAEYYQNTSLADEPVQVGTIEKLDFTWKETAPIPELLADRVSIRWQGYFNFNADKYRFLVKVDDGARLWVDDQLLIDQWQGSPNQEYFADLNMTAGKHLIRVEYKEESGWANAKVSWEQMQQCTGVPTDSFCGEYFDSDKLEGTVIRTQVAPKIDFDWADQRPMHGLKNDKFSARWQGQFNFNAGYYRFTGDADDGISLWVDGIPIIEQTSMDWQWKGQVQAVPFIAEGLHTVKVEYRENYGTAKIKLHWQAVEGCYPIPNNSYCLELFNNKDLTGFVRDMKPVSAINENWGEEQPSPLVNKDNFSARWKGKQYFAAGTYRAMTDTDQGVVVKLDNQTIINQWGQQNAKQQKILTLTEGWHDVIMDTFDSWSVAKAKLTWEKLPDCKATPLNQFCAEFYGTNDLTGELVGIQLADKIDFDWAADAPTAFVPKDKFSVRWTGTFDLEAGLYRFVTDADDAIRIWIDDKEFINAWTPQGPWYGKQRRLIQLPKGLHKIKVEYREDWGSAKAKLTWEKVPDCSTETPTGKFCTSFYNTKDLTGEIADNRYDNAINFDWSNKSPQEGVNADFSARWGGKMDFAEGEYTFSVKVDDGFKLWVDGVLVIDSWKPQAATLYSKRIFLTGGLHTLKAEYYDGGGLGVAQLSWKSEQLSEPQVPVNLKTSTLAQDKVVLTWDIQPIVSQYNIYKDGTLLATVNTNSLTDLKVSATQTYAYSVSAVWPNGRESRKALLSVTIPDTQAPIPPKQITVQTIAPTSVTLVWTGATDNIGIKSYQVWRDGVQIAETSDAGFVDSTLQSTGKYLYTIKALDAAGNISVASTSLSVTTKDGISPTIPTGLKAQVLTPTQIALTWDAATDNVGVTHYRILRNNLQIATSTQPQYTDTKAVENTQYSYQIRAADAAGNVSAPSIAVQTISGDATAPSAPTDLAATVDTNQKIRLTWSAATDNKGVKQYRIVRDGRLLALTPSLYYTDTTVKVGQTYTYVVKALDAANNASLDSNSVVMTPSGICESTQLYFKQSVETSINTCATCHIAGGMGQNSRFILSNAPESSLRNLGAISTLNQTLGKQTILDKASGKLTHGGGTVFTLNSMEYNALGKLLDQLKTPGQCTDIPDSNEPIMTQSLVSNCASCHGTNGASAGPATPSLGGLSQTYLSQVLNDYKTGKRASLVMSRIAKGYSADEINLIAEYYSKQPFTAGEQTTDAGKVQRGQALHTQYCASCHITGGKDGALTGARLAGQWKPYMERTLVDYAQNRSQPNTSGMAEAIKTLFTKEGRAGLEALSEYYAHQSTDLNSPSVPTELAAESHTPTSTTLTWMDSSDDWGVLYYDIYRDGVWVGRTRFNTFTDMGLKAGTYKYTVVAVDTFGNRSIISESVTATLTSEEATPQGLKLLSYAETLRKASLILLNRLPTAAESATATSEETFRTTLRNMMDTKGALDQFVYRAGHEVFLSNGAAWIGSGMGLSSTDYPALNTLTDTEKSAANDAVRREPVLLMQYLVGNDKPWTEILTADYTVMNPQLAKATGATPIAGAFTNLTNAKEYLPVRIPQVSARYPGKAFAHAGVLSTNAWLSRFPTTDTNRNRHRSAQVYKQFLALDIEAIAQRPLDDSKNGNYRVPTMQNANCMVCHTVMEPVAGAFRDWGNNSRYLQNFDGAKGDKDSLAWVYKTGGYPLDNNGQPWYHAGDTWYRDMFPTGFNNRAAPGGYEGYAATTWTTTDNLLKSPSAEQGVIGWTLNKGTVEATNKATCSRVPRDPKSGSKLYQVGSCTTPLDEALVWQDIDITAYAPSIDKAKAGIEYGAYFSALYGQDKASIWVEYLDKTGKNLGKSALLSDQTSWTWANKTATATVPATTRKLRFVMQGLRSTQTWADKFIEAYVDDAFLVLRTPDTNVLPIVGTQDTLQWLGKQLIQDSRFSKGGVYFWFKPVFKRLPLTAPVDTTATDYAQKMAAYNAQDEILSQLANRFSYNQGRGAWNVKDLLIDMVASPLFRAKAGQLGAEQQYTLTDMGLSRLLTPEELYAKVKSLMGSDWYWFRPESAWGSSMGLFYGGFDGGHIQTKPNTIMNSLMNTIPERMAIELSCNATADDFRLASSNRKLFPYVEATDTPVYEEVDTSTLNLLVNPGAESGLDGWTLEQGTVRVLSGAPWSCEGGVPVKSGKAQFNPGSMCKNPSPIGRLYQTSDVTAWDDSIDKGEAKVLFGAALRGWSVDNDEASVYLSFRDGSDNELSQSQVLMGKEGYWQNQMAYAPIPAFTRSIRFYMQGKRIDTSTNPNNDSFVDDTFLRVITEQSAYMPAGEKRIRANLQYLHKQFLNETLAIDDPEITRSFNLFSEAWADRSAADTSCRLYTSWEDPSYTKRAWGTVLLYLMTDARFIYE